ncbi:MAG: PrsW family glutamic-type intramembrane protease [Flavobacteriales bacterium]
MALALLILYLSQYGSDIRTARALAPGLSWTRIPIMRSLAVFVALVFVPPLFVLWVGNWVLMPEWPWLWVASVVVSGLISYTWYRYLAWLDVHEPEQRWVMLLVFLFAVVLTYFVPDLYRAVERATAWDINGEFLNDLLYSVVVIGGLEESAKLIPYLVLLLFTKRINEPYDHLLYLSLSALGFAFVENMHYLHRSDLFAVTGRALYASVAHMCFSSFIGYGVARALPKGRGHAIVVGMLMFLVACAAHGLYDVWLVAPGRPTFLTTIFFLGTIQIWVIMKNNLINTSPFAEPHRKLRSTMFRYRIVNAMLAIFMLAFMVIHLMKGSSVAWDFYGGQWVRMLVMLLILAISFGSYQVVPGYVARLGVSPNPIRWFLPIGGSGEDLSGTRIRVDIPERSWKKIDLPELRRALPVMGVPGAARGTGR